MEQVVRSNPKPDHWLSPVVSLAAIVIGLAVLYLVNPIGSKIFPPCPFHKLTGLDCPGCGTARGLHQLLHGHLLAALRLNPLTVILTPYIVYSFLSGAVMAISGKKLPSLRLPWYSAWVLFGVMMVFWVLRNIPVYPFTLFAP